MTTPRPPEIPYPEAPNVNPFHDERQILVIHNPSYVMGEPPSRRKALIFLGCFIGAIALLILLIALYN